MELPELAANVRHWATQLAPLGGELADLFRAIDEHLTGHGTPATQPPTPTAAEPDTAADPEPEPPTELTHDTEPEPEPDQAPDNTTHPDLEPPAEQPLASTNG
jgi:hypothetical protein